MWQGENSWFSFVLSGVSHSCTLGLVVTGPGRQRAEPAGGYVSCPSTHLSSLDAKGPLQMEPEPVTSPHKDIPRHPPHHLGLIKLHSVFSWLWGPLFKSCRATLRTTLVYPRTLIRNTFPHREAEQSTIALEFNLHSQSVKQNGNKKQLWESHL